MKRRENTLNKKEDRVWESQLKTQHWKKKTKIMASGPITSWQIEGEKVETMTAFLFLGSEITEDGDCSHKIRRWLPLGRKAMTNLDNVLKSKGFTLPTKVHIVKVIVFGKVMCRCESWTIKKAEHRRIDAFESIGGAGENFWESPGQQGDQTSQS